MCYYGIEVFNMFSDKILNKGKPMLQQDNIDKTLRNDLWNSIQKFYLDRVYYINMYREYEEYSRCSLGSCVNDDLILDLYENFFILPINDMKSKSLLILKQQIEDFYNKMEWYKIYDFVEYLSDKIRSKDFDDEINKKLERNRSAYRLFNKNICPITNSTEINSIQQASSTSFENVNVHINKAVELFSNKQSPDYENVIKESITAVETMCSIIVGNKTTLGNALNKMEDSGVSIHPSLKTAFSKLYGYTSDGNGIRHAGDIGGTNSTFSEAKFMLISCSAFVNYLIENYSKSNN